MTPQEAAVTSTATKTTQPASEFWEWQQQCPLRVWRHAQRPHVSIIQAASQFGVSMTTIRLWELGTHPPGENAAHDSVSKLKRVLGEDFLTVWMAWLARKPML